MSEKNIFTSILSPYMEGLLEEKRALGFDYSTEEMILLRFDRYCTGRDLKTIKVSREFLDEWCMQSETEGLSNHRKRITVVRQLMYYMLSLGIPVYLPDAGGRRETVMPHIFTDAELQSFFNAVDAYEPGVGRPACIRLAKEYRVLFRLLYCCGLRNTEGCGLASDQVDLKTGTITIINSKGNKDRLVYMASDLTELCREYHKYLRKEFGTCPEWFFPGADPRKPLKNTSVDRAFNRCWFRTEFAEKCNNKPTVHDLRFTFVTDRINQWAVDGVDVDVMMPYLQKYLGHKSLQDSYYYYHNSGQLYDAVRQKDKTSDLVIPEVMDYE